MGYQNPTLDTFLQAWESHHRLRRTGASIAALSESRAHLDQMRLNLRRGARR